MGVRVDVSEVLAHARAVEASIGKMQAGIFGVMQETLDRTVQVAKPKFRRATGASADGGTGSDGGDYEGMTGEVIATGVTTIGEAGTDTPYWPFNEFGTVNSDGSTRLAAKPAVIPAQIETEGFFEGKAAELIESVLP